MPRMDDKLQLAVVTTAQRNTLVGAAAGSAVFNSDTSELQVFDGTWWNVPGSPCGTSKAFYGTSAEVPGGYLFEDGSAVSRTTYAQLFAILVKTTTVTITLASPGVFTSPAPHRLQSGDPIKFSTTGALPTGLVAGTTYYVMVLSPTTFKVRSVSPAGSDVNTSVSQSGTHTALSAPYGEGNGTTTFNLPDSKGRVPVTADTGVTKIASRGLTGGTWLAHSHTGGSLSAASHHHGLSAVTVNNHTHPVSPGYAYAHYHTFSNYATLSHTHTLASGFAQFVLGAATTAARTIAASFTDTRSVALATGATATARSNATGLGGTTDGPNTSLVAGNTDWQTDALGGFINGGVSATAPLGGSTAAQASTGVTGNTDDQSAAVSGTSDTTEAFTPFIAANRIIKY